MSPAGIVAYVIPAALFALAMGTVWLLVRRRKCLWRELALVGYLAALAEIIALRFGAVRMPHTPVLIPLSTTLGGLNEGLWPFVYHALGNMLWFAPLGIFLGGRRAWQAALTGAGVSLALELLQLILQTGTTDVDDILLNTLGTLLGFGLIRLWKKLH